MKGSDREGDLKYSPSRRICSKSYKSSLQASEEPVLLREDFQSQRKKEYETLVFGVATTIGKLNAVEID